MCVLTGKFAETRMRCRWYDPETDTSLVECHPVTGRTHQIRLHLQLIGNPIANDPCYGKGDNITVRFFGSLVELTLCLLRTTGGKLYFGDEQKMASAVDARQKLHELGKCFLLNSDRHVPCDSLIPF